VPALERAWEQDEENSVDLETALLKPLCASVSVCHSAYLIVSELGSDFNGTLH